MQTNIATRARITTIELVPANSATDLLWTFPDQPYLRDKKILGVYLSANEKAPISGVTNLYPGLVLNNVINAFITIVDNFNNKFIENLPLKLLSSQQTYANDVNDAGYNVNGILAIDNKLIQWNKSYIKFAEATTIASRCVVLNVIYI